LEEDKPWADMDPADLENALPHEHCFAAIADFLMRRQQEVEAKAIELELFRSIEERPKR
jgi:hypothetical protein